MSRTLTPATGRALDVLLATAAAVGFALEGTLTSYARGPAWATVAVAAGLGLSLLWRRRLPLVPVAGVAAAYAAHGAALTRPDEMIAMFLTLIAVGYATMRFGDGPTRTAAVAIVLAVPPLVDTLREKPVENIVFPPAVVCVALVAGRTVDDRTREARVLAERTHELEAERAGREHAAVLAERRRIARELHDVVAHTVSVMVVQAAGARRTLDRDPARALTALGAVRATGEDALTELDRLLGLLGPEAESAAASRPGIATLAQLVDRSRAAGVPVTVSERGSRRPLDAGADLAAYRVVQEALTNTLKHGGGAAARVALAWSDDALEIVVSDDGGGLDGPRGDGARRGLQGMRERVEAYGGELTAGPGPVRGFEVRARIPLRHEREVQAA